MTKEEWEKADEALSGVFGAVELLVDGHKNSFHRKQISKNRLGIMTYVDGWYKGEWCLSKDGSNYPSEAAFLRPVTKHVWSRKHREEMKKLPKRILKEHGWDPDKKITYPWPTWNNVESIRRYYEKTFKDIKLVKVNGKIIQ